MIEYLDFLSGNLNGFSFCSRISSGVSSLLRVNVPCLEIRFFKLLLNEERRLPESPAFVVLSLDSGSILMARAGRPYRKLGGATDFFFLLNGDLK